MKPEVMKPNWLDRLLYWSSRPCAVAAAVGFLLVPSELLLAAMKTGASFLNIGVGARPIGMGLAYTAVADDVDAIYWNPGGLSLLNQRQVSAMHADWLVQSRYDFIGLGVPASWGTWGLGFSRLTQGEQEARGEDRSRQGSFQAYDQARFHVYEADGCLPC